MATNFYFNNFEASGEQSLVEDLIIESIKIHGIDVYYLPRTIISKDTIFNEDDLSKYEHAHSVEMYIKTVDGFEGDGDFLSKFGLQIRDSMTLSVAMRRWDADVGDYHNMSRPLEGDLLYLPLNKKMFEIQHVEHESIFYQVGNLNMYDLRAELFEFSQERFETAVPVIDEMYDSIDTTDVTDLPGLSEVDPIANNEEFEVAADEIIDWNEENPFGDW